MRRGGAGVVLDSSTGEVYRGDRRVGLSPMQFEIFYYAWRSRGPRSTQEIFDWLYQLKPDCDRPPDPHEIVPQMIAQTNARLRPLGLAVRGRQGRIPEGYLLWRGDLPREAVAADLMLATAA